MKKFQGGSNGFSLVEMLMVLAVLGVVAAMAAGVTPSMLQSARADSALTSVINAVELARDRSVGERREFQVIFTAPNRIQVLAHRGPRAGHHGGQNTYLDNGQTYMKFTGVPDTPDAFGNASAIYFGVTPTIRLHERRLAPGFERRPSQRQRVLRRSRQGRVGTRAHDLWRHGAHPRMEMGWQEMGAMTMRREASIVDAGFSLIEAIISTAILAGGLLTLAGVLAQGMRYMAGSSPESDRAGEGPRGRRKRAYGA